VTLLVRRCRRFLETTLIVDVRSGRRRTARRRRGRRGGGPARARLRGAGVGEFLRSSDGGRRGAGARPLARARGRSIPRTTDRDAAATDATSAGRRASRKRTRRRRQRAPRPHVRRTANAILRSQYGRRLLCRYRVRRTGAVAAGFTGSSRALAADCTAFSSGSEPRAGRRAALSPISPVPDSSARQASVPSSGVFFAEIGRRHCAIRRRLKRRRLGPPLPGGRRRGKGTCHAVAGWRGRRPPAAAAACR